MEHLGTKMQLDAFSWSNLANSVRNMASGWDDGLQILKEATCQFLRNQWTKFILKGLEVLVCLHFRSIKFLKGLSLSYLVPKCDPYTNPKAEGCGHFVGEGVESHRGLT